MVRPFSFLKFLFKLNPKLRFANSPILNPSLLHLREHSIRGEIKAGVRYDNDKMGKKIICIFVQLHFKIHRIANVSMGTGYKSVTY
jgi:hypothetical protein